MFYASSSSSSKKLTLTLKRQKVRDLPGGPVAKTSRFQCRGLGFNPWSGTRSHMPQLKIPHAAMKTEDPEYCNYDLALPNKDLNKKRTENLRTLSLGN